MIFFNIAWMKNYQRQEEGDLRNTNFSEPTEYNIAYEQYNFLPKDGYVYGYSPLKEYKNINISKLGARKNENEINEVTVIYFSKHPDKNASFIVGWYKNAILYRKVQPGYRKIDGNIVYYRAKAKTSDAHCLSESERIFEVPTAHKQKGGYGQSPIWYAQDIPEFQGKVLNYISDYTDNQNKYHGNKHTCIDTDTKYKIEKSAIETTISYYKKHGYRVESVEHDNCGWDLTVSINDNEYFVEVKGNASSTASFQLTPNEYAKLKEHYQKYRIAIVTNCLKVPVLDIYKISKQKKSGETLFWGTNEKGLRVDLIEKIELYAVSSFFSIPECQ